jgi:peptide chain release factor subunit 1
MPTLDQLNAQLDRLAALEPGPFPVVSLYLNMQPNERGRDQFGPFLRKELSERLRTYGPDTPERASLEADAEKIREYVETQVDGSANGLAMFASGATLFEAVQLAAPIPDHRLYISDQPHLYPLARLIDEFPRYAVLTADTNSARIFVFALNDVQRTESIQGVKTKRHSMGGSSQARYQRHVENYHLHHAKEVVDTLDAIVREEGIDTVIVTGDEVIVPLLKEQFSKELAARVVDVLKLNVKAPQREVLEASIAALRQKDAETDRERVGAMMDAYRANGLACVGVEAVRRAFELGQVDELLISASQEDSQTAEEMIAQARKTSAKIRFIQDQTLLEPVEGIGAFLRFLITAKTGGPSESTPGKPRP